MKKIALLSTASILGFFNPDAPNIPSHNLHEKGASVSDLSHFSLDFEALTDALSDHALDYEIVSWSDPNMSWSDFDGVLMHTPWDYYNYPDKFIHTLEKINQVTLLFNDLETIRWNMNKTYLRDLKKAGLNIIDTIYVDTAITRDLLDFLPQVNWEEGLIFKPSISAGATDVVLVHSPQEATRVYKTAYVNRHPTLMIQPFMREIQDEGEWSFLFFNGEYSHAVLKKTEEGGIGVKHSINNKNFTPTHDMVKQAKHMMGEVIQLRGETPLYARLDTIKRSDKKLYIMELELIEPFLYLHASENAATHLVKGLVERLNPHKVIF